MSYSNDDHARHGHLDNGRCLDGSGRDWEPVPYPGGPVARSGEPVSPPVVTAFLLRRIDALANRLLVLTGVVVLVSLSVLLLAMRVVL